MHNGLYGLPSHDPFCLAKRNRLCRYPEQKNPAVKIRCPSLPASGDADGYWQTLCKVDGMNWTQVVGLFAGVCTASSLLPQLIKTIKEKKVDEISKGMLIVLMTGVATWVVYGILRSDMPIILTNSFSLLLNISMLFLRVKYSRHAK